MSDHADHSARAAKRNGAPVRMTHCGVAVLVRIRFADVHKGEPETAKGPVDSWPGEPAHHGWCALVRQAEQDCAAKTVTNATVPGGASA